MITAIVITPDDELTSTAIDETDYKAYQAVVGGLFEYVAAVNVPGDHYVIVNQEPVDMRLNATASFIAGRPLVGTVLIVGPPKGGNDTSVAALVIGGDTKAERNS